MFEAIIAFLEINVFWVALVIFLLTLCNIAFDIFKERKIRKWAEKGFRGALPTVIHKPR